ncbi:Maltodextrin phosphorylase [Edwardsiella tarda]|nr:Maltodextrin phosphorylase [Edwardsiella tarda]
MVDRIRRIKSDNKLALSNEVYRRYRLALDPLAMFDVHAKRFHEYKRQLLNVLHIIYQYQRIQEGAELATPKIYFFAGRRRRVTPWPSSSYSWSTAWLGASASCLGSMG